MPENEIPSLFSVDAIADSFNKKLSTVTNVQELDAVAKPYLKALAERRVMASSDELQKIEAEEQRYQTRVAELSSQTPAAQVPEPSGEQPAGQQRAEELSYDDISKRLQQIYFLSDKAEQRKAYQQLLDQLVATNLPEKYRTTIGYVKSEIASLTDGGGESQSVAPENTQSSPETQEEINAARRALGEDQIIQRIYDVQSPEELDTYLKTLRNVDVHAAMLKIRNKQASALSVVEAWLTQHPSAARPTVEQSPTDKVLGKKEPEDFFSKNLGFSLAEVAEKLERARGSKVFKPKPIEEFTAAEDRLFTFLAFIASRGGLGEVKDQPGEVWAGLKKLSEQLARQGADYETLMALVEQNLPVLMETNYLKTRGVTSQTTAEMPGAAAPTINRRQVMPEVAAAPPSQAEMTKKVDDLFAEVENLSRDPNAAQAEEFDFDEPDEEAPDQSESAAVRKKSFLKRLGSKIANPNFKLTSMLRRPKKEVEASPTAAPAIEPEKRPFEKKDLDTTHKRLLLVEAHMAKFVQDFKERKLSPEQEKEALRNMTVRDPEGSMWRKNVDNNSWMRWENDKWVTGDPYQALNRLNQQLQIEDSSDVDTREMMAITPEQAQAGQEETHTTETDIARNETKKELQGIAKIVRKEITDWHQEPDWDDLNNALTQYSVLLNPDTSLKNIQRIRKTFAVTAKSRIKALLLADYIMYSQEASNLLNELGIE